MTHQDDVKAVIPPLSFEMHKGQYGKVGIVGGCVEYTGAPYYAGISALKTGVDLCHIFCAPEAATPIKCYSPELIVHPFLSLSSVEKITPVLGRLDALVVGPGLGRDPDILDAAKAIVSAAKAMQLPVVLDGDALFLLSNDISLIHGYPHAILTPNIMEYGRLCVSLGLMDKLDLTLAAAISPDLLATKLGHVTVLQKGRVDKISDGHAVVEQASQGSPRRCGGQGDVLAGSVGAFLAWHGAKLKRAPTSVPKNALTLAALGGSLLTREWYALPARRN